MPTSTVDSPKALESVFVIYPRHLEWLMQDHRLTVSEICVALGLPSLQEWYNICKEPDQPVRNARIVQNARLYLRYPSLLPSGRTPLEELVHRTERLFDDQVLGRRLLEAIFHKHWDAIERWMLEDEMSIDLSARRFIKLLMELDDDAFKSAVMDAAVNTRVQVKAEEVKTRPPSGSSEGRYVVPKLGEMSIRNMLDAIPTPGRRIKKDAYVVPSPGSDVFQTQVAAARSRSEEEDAGEDLSSEAMKAIAHAPWNQAKK